MAKATSKHLRAVSSIGDGTFMVIETNVKDARLHGIFGPAADRVRSRGAEVREQLKNANSKRR